MCTRLWHGLLFAWALIYSGTSMADEIYLRRVYLDQKSNVHVVTRAGVDMKLTENGHCYKLGIAGDKRTVAWRINTSKKSSAVMVYRDGVIKTIKGGPFIRDFWFVKKGRQIAVDSGGMHFAGVEILYDVATLKELDSVDQADPPTDDKCYKWAQACGGTGGH